MGRNWGFLSVWSIALTVAICLTAHANNSSGEKDQACIRAAREILDTNTAEQIAWPFRSAIMSSVDGKAEFLSSSDLTTFVLKVTRGRLPKKILLDSSALPSEGTEAADFARLLEKWATDNRRAFEEIANDFDVSIEALVEDYFSQKGVPTNFEKFFAAIRENKSNIIFLRDELNKIPLNQTVEWGVVTPKLDNRTIISMILRNPIMLKDGFTLREAVEHIEALKGASNNLKLPLDEFASRLHAWGFTYKSFQKLFDRETVRKNQPSKWKSIVRGLESRAKELRRVTKFEKLRDAPWEFEEFTERLLRDGADQALIWMSNLHPTQIVRIFKTIKTDLAQKFVTAPDLVTTMVSLTVFDTLVFSAMEIMSSGTLGANFWWTLGSIVASEVPITFASVDRMAAVAAREYGAAVPNLTEAALQNAKLTMQNAVPKTMLGIRNWLKDAGKDAPMLFTYSALMTTATQLTRAGVGQRDPSDPSVECSVLEIAVWFSLIANLRYKLMIGRIQVPLSDSTFFRARPKANFAMIQGVTATNIITGNALWVWWYSPYFRSTWQHYVDGKTPGKERERQANEEAIAAKIMNDDDPADDLSETSRMAEVVDALEEKALQVSPMDISKYFEIPGVPSVPNSKPASK